MKLPRGVKGEQTGVTMEEFTESFERPKRFQSTPLEPLVPDCQFEAEKVIDGFDVGRLDLVPEAIT